MTADSYRRDQVRRVIESGSFSDEREVYGLKVSGAVESKWLNITPEELEQIAVLLAMADGVADERTDVSE